jgi:hypothetical protein
VQQRRLRCVLAAALRRLLLLHRIPQLGAAHCILLLLLLLLLLRPLHVKRLMLLSGSLPHRYVAAAEGLPACADQRRAPLRRCALQTKTGGP